MPPLPPKPLLQAPQESAHTRDELIKMVGGRDDDMLARLELQPNFITHIEQDPPFAGVVAVGTGARREGLKKE